MDANITINILITIKNKISMNIFKKIKLINTAKTATNLIKYTAIHAVKLHIVKLKLKGEYYDLSISIEKSNTPGKQAQSHQGLASPAQTPSAL